MRKHFTLLRPRCAVRKIATVFASILLLALVEGCGISGSALLAGPALSLSATALSVPVGNRFKLQASGSAAAKGCLWTSSLPSVLASSGDGVFQSRSNGTALATVSCGITSATAFVVVTSTAGPITITHGGTYSGNWVSNDPETPAVSIRTNEPVTLRDATIAGRGDLISIQGTSGGAHVTVKNVTGAGLDPQVAGMQRGSFVTAEQVASLRVRHCTMLGVRFGVKVLSSTATKLSIKKNVASELEDRESDGQGGFLNNRPDLGHFVMLNQVSAPNGAEIAWNQVIDTIGESSTEDVINIFKSQGAPGAPIAVHDNYIEGYSSPATTSYTGVGLITDGDSSQPVTSYVTFSANEIVHAAGSGIEVAVGHDILAKNNRVVSCGIDGEGKWYAAPFVNAVVMWNYYGAPQFTNNQVDSTWGGMLRPAPDGTPMIVDAWERSADLNSTDGVQLGSFTDPCYPNGELDLGAEDAERAYWQTKLSLANITPGDQHTF